MSDCLLKAYGITEKHIDILEQEVILNDDRVGWTPDNLITISAVGVRIDREALAKSLLLEQINIALIPRWREVMRITKKEGKPW